MEQHPLLDDSLVEGARWCVGGSADDAGSGSFDFHDDDPFDPERRDGDEIDISDVSLEEEIVDEHDQKWLRFTHMRCVLLTQEDGSSRIVKKNATTRTIEPLSKLDA